MVFVFDGNVFNPTIMQKIWIELASLGWDRTTKMEVEMDAYGGARLILSLAPMPSDLPGVREMVESLGGRLVGDQVLRFHFSAGTYNPGELAWTIDHLDTIHAGLHKKRLTYEVKYDDQGWVEVEVDLGVADWPVEHVKRFIGAFENLGATYLA